MESISREELELRYEAVYGTAVDGIIVINQKGIIESVNPSTCRLFGYSEAELVGYPVHKLMANPHREAHDGYISQYLSTGHKKIIGIGREVQGLRKDGSSFPFWLSVSEFKIHDATVFTGFVHDITELKNAELEIKQLNAALEAKVSERTEQLADVVNRLLASNKKLEREVHDRQTAQNALHQKQDELLQALEREKELSELKSRFVSMASHEFRTPLATILSSTALVRRYAENNNVERQLFHLEKIRTTINTLTSILNDFLSLTKLEEGRIINNPEWFDLESFCYETIEEIKGLAKNGQNIFLQFDGDMRTVYMDPRLLKNVLYNLLSNAIKYSEKNIFFNVCLEPGNLSIDVIDQGLGIPENDQIHLFDRFFRASNVTNIQGVGLGMNIVRRYMEIMGGEISFESKEGSGTTFSLRFSL
ncbi:MAG: PAS domain-containing sensor histidine kinase [Bacteroidetes bacterium]|nr:PAS domain-containing sensor histidine kinase [Bacteroidota bacterium]